jgi:hypothetical protein
MENPVQTLALDQANLPNTRRCGDLATAHSICKPINSRDVC